MRVYRLHYRNDPRRGPWYLDEMDSMLYLINGEMPDYGAYAADREAQREHVKLPDRHPGPQHDPKLMGLRNWSPDEPDPDWYFGFISLDQYADWFKTPGVRRALLRENLIVLACYEVPDEDVLVGTNQVVFKMTTPRKEEVVPEHIAIYLTQ